MISGPLIMKKFASDSDASAFAINVLPQPGEPYISMPLCGSIPSLAKTSGWRMGSSTISRKRFIWSFMPPISSYVTRGFLSLVISSIIVSLLCRFILTMAFGATLWTLKSIWLPKMTTEISSPTLTGMPLSLLFIRSQKNLAIIMLLAPIGIGVMDFVVLQAMFMT